MTILYLSCSCVFGIFQCLYFHYVTACSLSRSLHPSFPMSVLVIRMFLGWLGSRVVSVLDSGSEGPSFKSQWRRCRVTVLGKLFTPIVSLHQAAKLVAVLFRVAGVTQAWRKVMAAYRRVYDSRHLQADCQEPGSAAEPYAR